MNTKTKNNEYLLFFQCAFQLPRLTPNGIFNYSRSWKFCIAI